MALLLVSGTHIFASHVGAVPMTKRNGMMDRIRDRVENGAGDRDNDGNPNLIDPDLHDNQNEGDVTTDNNGTSTAPIQGTDSATGGADPLTSNDPATTTTPETTKAETTTKADDGVLDDEKGGFNWWGIIIAVAIAAAVVILIIALLPKK